MVKVSKGRYTSRPVKREIKKASEGLDESIFYVVEN